MHTHEQIMQMSANEAEWTMKRGVGGPFGAAVAKDGEIISIASNTVLNSNDPTAHAEINAIRSACKNLGTHDLSGYELYATGAPCPMCMAAIMWANIKKVYISGLAEDADAIGFRDEFMYRFMEAGCNDKDVVEIVELDRNIALNLYEEYKKTQGQLY